MNQKRLMYLVIALAATAMGSQAMADDLFPPPWRGGPLSTLAEWEFFGPLNPIPPDGALPVIVGDGMGPGVVPLATMSGAIAWFPSFDGDGAWLGTGPPGIDGYIDLLIPNWIDQEPLKIIQVQMTIQPQGGNPPRPHVESISASDPLGIDSVVRMSVVERLIDPLNFIFHRTEIWKIRPNPDWEQIRIAVPADSYVDQIVVDTISIPEPASMALVLVAVAGLAVHRRAS